jgi:mannosyltransferase OCH1-like enzyme
MLIFIIFFNHKNMTVLSNLKPRNDRLLKNKYSILKTFHHDFHLVIYYLSEKKCKIILRCLNHIQGWSENIQIEIENLQNKKESIIYSIGSSSFPFKIIHLYVQQILQPNDNLLENQQIPRTIIQTSGQRNIQNQLLLHSIYTFQELNPEYEYLFFNNQECRQFIQTYYDQEILSFYDYLHPGAFKADFFRYCYMYQFGGCYFDCKQLLRKPLYQFIHQNDSLILCQDNHKNGLFNAFLCAKPKHPLFLHAIQKIIYKIKNFDSIYGSMIKSEYERVPVILSLTGPSLLYEVFHELKLSYPKYVLCQHITGNTGPSSDSKYYKDFSIHYKGKYIITKNYPGSKSFGTHYSHLWRNRQLFYQNKVIINDYIIYTYPGQCSPKVNFYMLDNNQLIVENYKKQNQERSNDILYQLQIIHDPTCEEYGLSFKSSKENYQIITCTCSFSFPMKNYIQYAQVVYLNKKEEDSWNENKNTLTFHLVKNNLIYYLICILNEKCPYENKTMEFQIIFINKQSIKKKINFKTGKLYIEKIIKEVEIKMLNMMPET